MSVSRRKFLTTAVATASAVSWSAPRNAFAQDTDDIRIAQIGFKGQGRSHINDLKKRVVALCDVDQEVLDKQADRIKSEWDHQVEKFTDFRKLLERKDIDAVSIATPNHTHAVIAIDAAQAGKHVYVEKPASHNIWEGRQMVRAARKHNCIMQCGTQSRSSPSLNEAATFVRSGGLGKIEYAIGTCYKPRTSIGKLDTPLKIPATLDYDLWCGPAEKKELYRSDLHYDWHWDFNTGNGDMGNQGIHQMDIARWFLGEKTLAPRVVSIGGRLGYDDAGDTPNTQIVYLDYPKAPLIFETRGLPRSLAAQKNWAESMDRYRGSDIGVVIQCEQGHLLVPSYSEAIAYDRSGEEIKRWKGKSNHHDNWLAAIAAGSSSKLNAEVLEGHLSSSLCHMGGISYQLGEKKPAAEIAENIRGNDLLSSSFDRMASHLRANGVDIDQSNALTLGSWLELDTDTEMFTNNDAANQLRSRQQRKPFVIADLEGESTL